MNLDKNVQENIIKEFGLEELPEETQQEIISRMAETIIKSITINILGKLSDEDKEKFAEMQGKSSPEDVDSFLKSKIENYEQVIQDTIADYKNSMEETINKLKESLK